ncbi:MAG: hypothetical protein AAF514_24570, partial [Verrucomicrobiota bacterium]
DGNLSALETNSSLETSAPWPRFGNNGRGERRVIEDTLLNTPERPLPLIVSTGFPASFDLGPLPEGVQVTWRKNFVPIGAPEERSLLLPSTARSDVAFYDAILSSESGEMLSPRTFLVLADPPEATADSASMSFILPGPDAGNLGVEVSSDLSDWMESLDLETINTEGSTREIRVTSPGSPRRFFRISEED